MKRLMIRYKVKADRAAGNERYIELKEVGSYRFFGI